MDEMEKEIAAYMPEFNMAAGYADCVDIIKENFQNMTENVVAIGFYLKHIRDQELYKEGNYNSFGEFAREEFGLSPTSTSRYMSINDRFSIDGNSPYLMEDKKGFSKSQLQEMLYLTDEQLEDVSPDMTVKEIRALAASQEVEIECEEPDEQLPGQIDIEFFPEALPDGYQREEKTETVYQIGGDEHEGQDETQEETIQTAAGEVVIDADYREIEQEQRLSAYGLPKSEYPPDSLIATEGCGHQHNCFTCAMDCAIRGEDRYCELAPMGNPFPCTTMHVLQNLRIEVGDTCQFINHDLAFHRWGDHAASPCCRKCKSPCGYQCRKAAEQRKDITEPIAIVDQAAEECTETTSEDDYYDSIEFIRKVLNKEHNNLKFLKSNEKNYGREVIEETKVIIAALANMICELERMELKEKLAELEKEGNGAESKRTSEIV